MQRVLSMNGLALDVRSSFPVLWGEEEKSGEETSHPGGGSRRWGGGQALSPWLSVRDSSFSFLLATL